MANFDVLKVAGLIDPACALPPDELKAINDLTAEEVVALISVKVQLARVFNGKADWPPGGGVKLHALIGEKP